MIIFESTALCMAMLFIYGYYEIADGFLYGVKRFKIIGIISICSIVFIPIYYCIIKEVMTTMAANFVTEFLGFGIDMLSLFIPLSIFLLTLGLIAIMQGFCDNDNKFKILGIISIMFSIMLIPFFQILMK